MRYLLMIIVLVLAMSALAQSNGERWTAPPDADSKKNPLSGKPEMAAGGEKLFRRTCTSCHQVEPGKPQGKGPNLASEQVQQQSDGALFWKMSKGNSRSGMPSFSSLPESQRWQIVLFLRTLAKH